MGWISIHIFKVAKVIHESFTISYLRQLDRRETDVTANTGRLESSKYSLFFFRMRKK